MLRSGPQGPYLIFRVMISDYASHGNIISHIYLHTKFPLMVRFFKKKNQTLYIVRAILVET